VFQTVHEALDAPVVPSAGEERPPDEVVLDVTHGFRSHALLAVAGMSFTLSEWARRRSGGRRVRILYGAFDAKSDDDVTPIWDLTDIVQISRWNAALDALLRFGRADDLKRLCDEEARARVSAARETGATGAALQTERFIRTLGEKAAGFSDDLALLRLRSLLTRSAADLLRALDSKDAETWLHRLPLLRGSVEQLRKEVADLCATNVFGDEGLKATVALADLCGRMQQFAEQIALVREAAVTLHARASNTLKEPTEPGWSAARKAADDAWGAMAAEAKGKDAEGVDTWHSDISNERNDLLHCGLNEYAQPAVKLRRRLEKHVQELRARLAVEAGPALQQPPVNLRSAASCFLNLSNHSIATWPPDQVSAARALGFGEPAELPAGLPIVSPEADMLEVDALARDIADRAFGTGARGAFVAGEHSLAAALVSRLQCLGVRCYTATTIRDAQERANPDGTILKTSTFRFVRWREYPPL
jgi:CRISPR-associated DxTHG motif protein